MILKSYQTRDASILSWFPISPVAYTLLAHQHYCLAQMSFIGVLIAAIETAKPCF